MEMSIFDIFHGYNRHVSEQLVTGMPEVEYVNIRIHGKTSPCSSPPFFFSILTRPVMPEVCAWDEVHRPLSFFFCILLLVLLCEFRIFVFLGAPQSSLLYVGKQPFSSNFFFLLRFLFSFVRSRFVDKYSSTVMRRELKINVWVNENESRVNSLNARKMYQIFLRPF